MDANLIWGAGALLGVLHVAGPVALHATFRFTAHCKARLMREEELSASTAASVRAAAVPLTSLGFEYLGCYDLGELASHQRQIVALFSDPDTNDLATLTMSSAGSRAEAYLEFSTCFSNGLTIETNNNDVLPLTPANQKTRVFRFAKMDDPRELYCAHRRLIEKYAQGAWTVAETKGQEIARVIRTVENYGPRHAKLGYMRLSRDKASYQLTWKGAALMAWRGLWPTAVLRQLSYRESMHQELLSLVANGNASMPEALFPPVGARKNTP